MREYKVEARVYYSKVTLDKAHIAKSSSGEVQGLLEQYARDGWRLVSTDAAAFGFAMYVYLYFEREASVPSM